MEPIITLALPKGSLNTVGRGNTQSLLLEAGYDILGYEPGKEDEPNLRIANDPEIRVVLSRPQSMPLELKLGATDAGILGQDWAKEAELDGISLEEVANLEYGQTSVVVAAEREFVEQGEIYQRLFGTRDNLGRVRAFTEFVNVASEYFKNLPEYREAYGNLNPRIWQRGARSGTNRFFTIFGSDGLTESSVTKGLADLVVDVSQTGNSLRRLGLEIVDVVMNSEACLYSTRGLNGRKAQKVEEIARNLIGVVEARKRYYVVFDVQTSDVPGMNSYLFEKQLFSEEPTINPGTNYSQYSILVGRDVWPRISGELAVLGAKSIVRLTPQQVI